MTLEELDIQLDALKELTNFRFCKVDRLQEEREKSSATALQLQAQEYERRLEGLNGEADRINKILQACVNKDLYEAHHQELERRVNKLAEDLSTIQGKASQSSVDRVNTVALVGIAIGAISLLVNIIERLT